ncbi:hypothetical protein CAOG_04963 [Capsaspora owczarzaki ATCC 30864]|uniref:Uncharacterized protein n=1 Tax=Capsaspora owczarzaki (strain ATCC 30864) TaxID=595528 RepID=A0A0D2VSY1_CAPO3|nr:hypothetical protein CAOG_04963 [Capsaspora owczarzaki ATCC 30864]KJE94297.1 hypothetical protein CAOG_004963 [Capsaspora owczarzaki ATCC 30864]|eukprot:XP_004346648.1 hypothetical protein CAOG_04963 [Capsaspora owczarzaki ATCC 30864]
MSKSSDAPPSYDDIARAPLYDDVVSSSRSAAPAAHGAHGGGNDGVVNLGAPRQPFGYGYLPAGAQPGAGPASSSAPSASAPIYSSPSDAADGPIYATPANPNALYAAAAPDTSYAMPQQFANNPAGLYDNPPPTGGAASSAPSAPGSYDNPPSRLSAKGAPEASAPIYDVPNEKQRIVSAANNQAGPPPFQPPQPQAPVVSARSSYGGEPAAAQPMMSRQGSSYGGAPPGHAASPVPAAVVLNRPVQGMFTAPTLTMPNFPPTQGQEHTPLPSQLTRVPVLMNLEVPEGPTAYASTMRWHISPSYERRMAVKTVSCSNIPSKIGEKLPNTYVVITHGGPFSTPVESDVVKKSNVAAYGLKNPHSFIVPASGYAPFIVSLRLRRTVLGDVQIATFTLPEALQYASDGALVGPHSFPMQLDPAYSSKCAPGTPPPIVKLTWTLTPPVLGSFELSFARVPGAAPRYQIVDNNKAVLFQLVQGNASSSFILLDFSGVPILQIFRHSLIMIGQNDNIPFATVLAMNSSPLANVTKLGINPLDHTGRPLPFIAARPSSAPTFNMELTRVSNRDLVAHYAYGDGAQGHMSIRPTEDVPCIVASILASAVFRYDTSYNIGNSYTL